MAARVFCIDFGSAYTKVSLRSDPRAASDLFQDGNLAVDELKICVPSALALDRSQTPPIAVWGQAAANEPLDSPRYEVRRNWKKEIFGSKLGASHRGNSNNLDGLLKSSELRELAGRMGVPATQIDSLRKLVAAAATLSAPADTPSNSISLGRLAVTFFTRLRKSVLSYFESRGIADADKIPTRITVPAFRPESELRSHPGCEVIAKAVELSGWPLHPERPVISEPYANLIGVLTTGNNLLTPQGKIQYQGTFPPGLLLRVLGHPYEHPAYRGVVVDVGAFTTDFAMLTLDTHGNTISDVLPIIDVSAKSVPMGISDIDAAVMDALPTTKGDWLRRQAKGIDWEDFRMLTYSTNKPLRRNDGETIGKGEEAAQIQGCVQSFADLVAGQVKAFCAEMPPIEMTEVVLTGGGTNIPKVRDTILAAIKDAGWSYRKVHRGASAKAMGTGPVLVPLGEHLIRGGTALGGASVFFESEFC